LEKNYDTYVVANLLLRRAAKKIYKSVNSYQSYERISSGMLFMDHGVLYNFIYKSISPSDHRDDMQLTGFSLRTCT